MKKAYYENPYTVTSLVFLIVIVIGAVYLHWTQTHYGFILLLYCLVNLGIRLDDISRQIGVDHGRPSQVDPEDETIMLRLLKIETTLLQIHDILALQSAQAHKPPGLPKTEDDDTLTHDPHNTLQEEESIE